MDKGNIANNYEDLESILIEAEEDVLNGRVAPIENTFNDIRKHLLAMK